MSNVDPLFAQWLQAEALFTVGDDVNVVSKWGDTALVSVRNTTIATKEAALAEAARQLAFLGGPLVADSHKLIGEWAAFLGKVITITADDLGYAGGLDVFVIGVEDNRATGTSTVTVLRRL